MKGASIVLDMWETSGNRFKGRIEAVENYLKWHDPDIKPELFRGRWDPLGLVLQKYMVTDMVLLYQFSKSYSVFEEHRNFAQIPQISPSFEGTSTPKSFAQV
eukprot:Polyplicarium_translucidae@DN350_c0_g1_i1.p1